MTRIISEQANLSTIYDNVFIKAGGLGGTDAISDFPRNTWQIDFHRTKVRSQGFTSSKYEFEHFLMYANDNKDFVHTVELVDHRAVLCSKF